MPAFAAVDIGANSVRLKIARLVRSRLRVVHEDREVTRLGQSVFRNGTLEPTTMAHTVKVLRRFHRAVQEHGVDRVRVVATSALRDARNAASFIEWARAATGWHVEVISGLEEGRLIHLGVMSATRSGAQRVLLVDLGGGSCELTISMGGQIRQLHSLPLGAVRLTQEFLRRDPPKRKELARLREFIAEEIAPLQKRIAARKLQLAIATSGTAAALNRAWMARQRKKDRAPRSVPTAAVVKLADLLSRATLNERIAMPGIGPRRAEIIVAGAVVFAELFTRLGLRGFRYSPLGLRDGLLAQMATDYGRSARLQRQLQSERENALLAVGRHYGIDHKHAARVRQLAGELFGGLKSVHGLPPEYNEWLAAAAMLCEVGLFLSRTGRHRHTYYIIANSDIFGYTVEQRRIIATLARFLGKSVPQPGDRVLRRLRSPDRERIPKAVALLRLAVSLDQGRRGAVRGVSARAVEDRVLLKLKAGRGGADLELWALEKERAYFRQVFGRELVAAAS
ncbi:MAG TPA: Ppx/GppA phosphatase family protein [Terriglobales bacterium]|nr:Ppx/GppA phosphatase family protein [Terriglobales bacterium]